MSSSMTLDMILMLKDLASGPLGNLTNNVSKLSHTLMAVGQTAKSMGSSILQGVKPAISAFMEAEDAALRLDAAMMGANGQSHKLFPEMEKFAVRLGNELPGTAAQMENMFAALVKEGVSAENILNGVGRATGNLAVITGMGFTDAAKFAGQVSNAARIAAGDMEAFMDSIQRMYHLGVSTTDLGYAFSKAKGAFEAYGIAGKKEAQEMGVLLSMLMKSSGQSGETTGTAINPLFQTLYDFESGGKGKKIAAQLKAAGIEMDIFGKNREFKGVGNMLKELGKLKNASTEVQDAFLKLFGGGLDGQIAQYLIKSGAEDYKAMAKRAEEQANLTQRINKILLSLTNIWESAMGAFETTLGKLGKAIAPELKWLADAFGSMADKFGNFLDTHPKMAKFIAGFAAISGASLFVGGTLSLLAGRFLAFFPLGGIISFVSTKFMGLYSAMLKIGIWNAAAGVRLTAWVTGLPGKMALAMSGFSTWILRAVGGFFGGIGRMATGIAAFGGRIVGLMGALGKGLIGFPSAAVQGLKAIPSLLTKIPHLLTLIATGIRAVGLAAIANPVGLIFTAIVIVVALAAAAVYKYWKPISGFFKGLWHGLMVGLRPLAPAFNAAFAKLAPILKPIMSALKSLWGWLKSLLSPVDDVGNRGQKMGVRFGLAIANMINKGAELLAYFIGLPGKFFSIGSNLINSLKNGVMSAWAGLKATLSKISNDITSTVSGALGIKSPSRVFMGLGNMLGVGLQIGMDSQIDKITQASKRMAIATIPSMKALSMAPASLPSMKGPTFSTQSIASARSGAAGFGGGSISFAPVIHVSVAPGMPSPEQQLQSGLQMGYQEFRRLMARYNHDERRVTAQA